MLLFLKFSQKWDMIVVDSLFTPTGVMLSGILKCPAVVYHTTWASAAESLFRGIPYVPSSMPVSFLLVFKSLFS